MNNDPQVQFNLRQGETLARLDELANPDGRPPLARSTARETGAIILLLLGGFLWLLGLLPGIALVIGSIATALYLGRRLYKRKQSPPL